MLNSDLFGTATLVSLASSTGIGRRTGRPGLKDVKRYGDAVYRAYQIEAEWCRYRGSRIALNSRDFLRKDGGHDINQQYQRPYSLLPNLGLDSRLAMKWFPNEMHLFFSLEYGVSSYATSEVSC